MPVAVSNLVRTPMLVFAVMLASVALAASAQSASASSRLEGKLPANSWTLYPGEENITFESAASSPGAEICVGPMIHNASGYHNPLGWVCGGGRVEWEYSYYGYPGVYNPSATKYTFLMQSAGF
jgi:hypothetical protein